MSETLDCDLCVIGAGSGGLSVAAGASQMGACVVLIEKAKMGGDCLNYGCVPSKSLIAAGHAAQAIRGSHRYGVNGTEPGEHLLTWVLAISQRLKIGAIANLIAPYPTRSEVSKRAAGSYYAPMLFSGRTRRIVRLLGGLG